MAEPRRLGELPDAESLDAATRRPAGAHAVTYEERLLLYGCAFRVFLQPLGKILAVIERLF